MVVTVLDVYSYGESFVLKFQRKRNLCLASSVPPYIHKQERKGKVACLLKFNQFIYLFINLSIYLFLIRVSSVMINKSECVTLFHYPVNMCLFFDLFIHDINQKILTNKEYFQNFS